MEKEKISRLKISSSFKEKKASKKAFQPKPVSDSLKKEKARKEQIEKQHRADSKPSPLRMKFSTPFKSTPFKSKGGRGGKTETSEKKLKQLQDELKLAKEENLYLRAEFENFKKRSAQEMQKLALYDGERFITALAEEALDDLDRALDSVQEKGSFLELKEGLLMIHKKVSKVLKNFRVEIIDPLGKPFDPSYQSALSYVRDTKFPEGHVARTVKKAYKLKGKLLRPAQVVLSQKK